MLPSARFVFITLVTALICHRDGLGFASFGVFQASSAGLSSSSLHLFDWLKKSSIANDEKDSKDLKSSERLKERRVVLEKVSRTQNRDYNAEALARQPASVEVKDMQPKSFNFNKPNEFPNLYKGWIRKEGDQIAKQIMSATKTALSRGEKLIEVLFDPVPNVDEVAFGTEWNKKLRQDVIEDLKVPDIAAKRGGSSTLEWSNLYWANRLAAGISTSKQTIIAISISGEGVKSKFTPALVPNLKLVTLAEAKTGSFFQRYSTDKSLSAIIVLSPCSELHYRDAAALGDKLNGVPVIALNSPYSFRYDIGGGPPFNLVYVMKRIPKGWIYRQYPKDFEAILEGPNYEISRVATFPTQPRLPDISAVNMQASAAKYGTTGNDRIFQNRL